MNFRVVAGRRSRPSGLRTRQKFSAAEVALGHRSPFRRARSFNNRAAAKRGPASEPEDSRAVRVRGELESQSDGLRSPSSAVIGWNRSPPGAARAGVNSGVAAPPNWSRPDAHFEGKLTIITGTEIDAAVTMGCGDACPLVRAKQRYDWQIPDPREMPPEEFRKVRDLIAAKVMSWQNQRWQGATGKWRNCHYPDDMPPRMPQGGTAYRHALHHGSAARQVIYQYHFTVTVRSAPPWAVGVTRSGRCSCPWAGRGLACLREHSVCAPAAVFDVDHQLDLPAPAARCRDRLRRLVLQQRRAAERGRRSDRVWNFMSCVTSHFDFLPVGFPVCAFHAQQRAHHERQRANDGVAVRRG